MKQIIWAVLLLLGLSAGAEAQTRITALSHEQASATTQTITVDAAGAAVDLTGYSAVLLAVRGTYVVVTIPFEASPDGTNYFPLACTRVDNNVTETASGALTDTTRAWRCNVTGFTKFRTGSGTDWTSGTVNVSLTPVAAASDLGVTVNQATAANLNATVTGTVTTTPPSNASTNVAQINGVTPLMGAGNTGTGSPRVTIASDQAALPASQSGTWNLTNISGTVSLPTGAATAAKQPALGTAGTASADVLTVQGIASMTALKVDGSAVTQPVSGTVTANAGTNLNTSLLALEAGGNLATVAALSKAEDAAHTTADPGIPALAVRKDTAAALAGADGDYTPLISDASGRLHVNVGNTVTVGSHDVTNAGTFAVQAAQSGTWNVNNVSGTVSLPTGASTAANQTLTHTPITPGTATATKAELIGLQYNATQATFTDGQQGSLQGSSRGALYVATGADTFNVTVNAALPAGTNAIGKLAANSGVDIGDVDVTSFPDNEPFNVAQINGVAPSMGNGASGTGVQRVTLANDSTGILAGVTTVTTLTTLTGGGVAHDGADSGNPLKIGARAVNAPITAVVNNDRTDLVADLNGRIITAPYTNPENLVSGVTAAITNTTDTSVIAAAGAGVRNYVTSLSIINSHATVDTVVELKDGTTVIWRGFAKSAGGGFVVTFPNPLRGTANTAINCAAVTTGANVYCSAAGFKAP